MSDELPAAWLFQANPDRFDVDGYLKEEKEIRWLARQRAQDMKPGQTVFIWRNQGSESNAIAGVIAVALITEPPTARADNPAARRFWRDEAEGQSVELRVGLRVKEVATKARVIQSKWLAEDPECADLPNLRMRQHTNYALHARHARRLARLWERTGEDFNRAELLLTLQVYDRLFGKPISKLAGEPVADAALQTGRAVTSIYSKVMNFRSLDPRTEGVGQPNAGGPTEAVWNEFWTGKDIDRDRLAEQVGSIFEPGNDPKSLDGLTREAAAITEYSAEGTKKLVTHLRVERNRRVVADAKALWAVADPLLRCTVCSMSFAEMYGPLGQGYVEAHHHAIPIAKLDHPVVPTVEDLMPVCANCHRMLHRGEEMKANDLKDLVRRRRGSV